MGLRPSERFVGINKTVTVEGVGSIVLHSDVSCVKNYTSLRNVLYASSMMHDLISCTKARRNKFRTLVDILDREPFGALPRVTERSSGKPRTVRAETSENL